MNLLFNHCHSNLETWMGRTATEAAAVGTWQWIFLKGSGAPKTPHLHSTRQSPWDCRWQETSGALRWGIVSRGSLGLERCLSVKTSSTVLPQGQVHAQRAMGVNEHIHVFHKNILLWGDWLQQHTFHFSVLRALIKICFEMLSKTFTEIFSKSWKNTCNWKKTTWLWRLTWCYFQLTFWFKIQELHKEETGRLGRTEHNCISMGGFSISLGFGVLLLDPPLPVLLDLVSTLLQSSNWLPVSCPIPSLFWVGSPTTSSLS